MYTLYYSPGAASLVVHLMLIELGAEHTLRRVDTAGGEHKRPEYLALNPSGLIPSLIVDGQPVTEAAALLSLLTERHVLDAALQVAAAYGAGFLGRGEAVSAAESAMIDKVAQALKATHLLEAVKAEAVVNKAKSRQRNDTPRPPTNRPVTATRATSRSRTRSTIGLVSTAERSSQRSIGPSSFAFTVAEPRDRKSVV